MAKNRLIRHRFSLDLCLVLGLVFLLPMWSYSQPVKVDNDLEAVLNDWQVRQKIMKSVRYVLKGSTEFRDARRPPGNPIQPREGILLLDLVKHRFHYKGSEGIMDAMGDNGDEPDKWQYRQRVFTISYDGKRIYKQRHREINRMDEEAEDLYIAEGKMNDFAKFDILLKPIFFAHGFVGTVLKPILYDRWPLNLEPDDFLNQGLHPFNRFNLLVFQTEPVIMGRSSKNPNPGMYDELWINRSEKSAIHRFFHFARGNPWSHLEITWKETPHGAWVDTWNDTWSTKNQVRRISHLRVESMEVDPPISDSDFTIAAQPGMKVKMVELSPKNQGSNPVEATAVQKFSISPTGTWIELSREGTPAAQRRLWIFWVLGIGTTILVILGLRWRQKIANP